jgi:hypothetical protein
MLLFWCNGKVVSLPDAREDKVGAFVASTVGRYEVRWLR